jgi:seryl-tRNA synthetase
MLDMKFVRENVELVKESEKRRGRNTDKIDLILSIDSDWKSSIKSEQDLRKVRNEVSEQINKLKKEGKNDEANDKIAEMKSVAKQIAGFEVQSKELEDKRNSLLKEVGNVLHESVPKGKDESENVELKKFGEIKSFDFKHKDHIDLGLELDLFDLDTAAVVAGARFYYLKN